MNCLEYYSLSTLDSTEIDQRDDSCCSVEIPRMERQSSLRKHLENRASLSEMTQRGLISLFWREQLSVEPGVSQTLTSRLQTLERHILKDSVPLRSISQFWLVIAFRTAPKWKTWFKEEFSVLFKRSFAHPKPILVWLLPCAPRPPDSKWKWRSIWWSRSRLAAAFIWLPAFPSVLLHSRSEGIIQECTRCSAKRPSKEPPQTKARRLTKCIFRLR